MREAGSTGTMIDAHGSAVFIPLRCQFFTEQLVEGGWGGVGKNDFASEIIYFF